MKFTTRIALIVVLVWLTATAVVVGLMPAPRERVDYFLGGAAGTLLAAFAVFVSFVRRTGARNLFYKTRRRPASSGSSVLGI